MQIVNLSNLQKRVADIAPLSPVGRVCAVTGHTILVEGFESDVKTGDRLKLVKENKTHLTGDVIRIDKSVVTMLPDGPLDQISLSDRVVSMGPGRIAPCDAWIGRILDPYGAPLDDQPLPQGDTQLDVYHDPPTPMSRKPLGARLDTGFNIFNTMLPIVRGQRVGIFSGPGVGKSTLLSSFARKIEADIVILVLVGERGREIHEYARTVLGEARTKRTIVVASAADAPSTARARCPLTAMRIAEWFRDRGSHVLVIMDSVTRFAEAQREVAIMAGEFPSLRGFPASTPSQITKLAERAGPGRVGTGDITAILSVLVAGSDINEPVSDMLRGVLDGHILLDQMLAQRGHFPAVDLLASVSRALPDAASEAENAVITQARSLASVYSEASPLISAGLYTKGSDPLVDQAIAFRGHFMSFCKDTTDGGCDASFDRLLLCLRRCQGTEITNPGHGM
ncbi:FliI/YscN family ATPase [Marivita sp. S6314]|uniref:FliI/YscN family ATPase n=1 Tax=Marivita sp. S6314 TaxID=2926406 RepID=UPI001FF65A27|nr:FliI/YscN family ATPase [Marivita sp. S6314]MCK0151414.1 FliI/YscN family ATPase [Marivita sp. S6314]